MRSRNGEVGTGKSTTAGFGLLRDYAFVVCVKTAVMARQWRDRNAEQVLQEGRMRDMK